MSSSTAKIIVASAAILTGAVFPARGQDAPPQAIRLAVVDMDRVMSDSEMGRVEQAAIDRLRTERTSVLATKQKELEDLEESIRNASLSWSDERREARVREYESRRIELRRMNEDATRDVQNEFNRALAKLQRAALLVTAVLGKERGYTVILEKKTMPVLFASDTIDITDEVLQRINSQPAAQEQAGAPPPGGGR